MFSWYENSVSHVSARVVIKAGFTFHSRVGSLRWTRGSVPLGRCNTNAADAVRGTSRE